MSRPFFRSALVQIATLVFACITAACGGFLEQEDFTSDVLTQPAQEPVDLNLPPIPTEPIIKEIEEVQPETAADLNESFSESFENSRSSNQLITGEFAPYFEDGVCPFPRLTAERYDLRCGTLFVPENRRVNGGRVIELAVAILPAANGTPAVDPIVYLEGGPGGSALDGFAADPDGWAQYGFTQNRDLILFDQRGTGFSVPELDCDESDLSMGAEEIAETCKAELEAAGIDLAAYNTAENAADVADLVQALGYTEFNLLGISYGTRLGLAVMRDHPEGLRSVVLDSPFPPNANPAASEAGLAWGRFEAIFDACAADSPCNTTYPDLEQTFLDTVDLMNEEPIDDIYGDDLIALVERMLFSGAYYVFLIPTVINDAADGDLDLFFELEPELFGMKPQPMLFSSTYQSGIDDGKTDGDAVGMYNSVMCRDEFSFSSLDIADDAAQRELPDQVYYGLFGSTIDIFTTCDIWDVGTAEPFVNQPVRSNVPTLVLVGEFDPATPPEWGELTVETLTNGILVEIPGDGHSLVSSNSCAIGLMDAFFEDPTNLDTSCVDEIEPIYFDLGN